MENIQECRSRRTVWLAGSGLFPVAEVNVNDFRRLRAEFHQREIDLATAVVKSRKLG